jgi:formate dehydrogenase major subunit
MSVRDLIASWPLLRQISTGADGTGVEAMSAATRALGPRHASAAAARSVCPFCGVGCGQLIFHRGGKVVSVEGDPASPISEGRLCPKGAATYELLTHDARLTRVKYRAPYATEWTELDLETAMDMVADRVWTSRERFFEEVRDAGGAPAPLMQCASIAHLGGATLDNEENYLIKKLFTGGLGMVALSNQARI